MRSLVLETERAWQALGRVSYGPTEKELKSLVYRRSLYVVQDMLAGDVFTHQNVRAIRPGYGLPPKFIDSFLGKKVSTDVTKGTPVCWEILG